MDTNNNIGNNNYNFYGMEFFGCKEKSKKISKFWFSVPSFLIIASIYFIITAII